MGCALCAFVGMMFDFAAAYETGSDTVVSSVSFSVAAPQLPYSALGTFPLSATDIIPLQRSALGYSLLLSYNIVLQVCVYLSVVEVGVTEVICVQV